MKFIDAFAIIQCISAIEALITKLTKLTKLTRCLISMTMQTPRKSPAFLLVRIHGDAYAYSGDTNTFTRVPRMPPDLPEQLESALLQLHVIDQGKSAVTESRGFHRGCKARWGNQGGLGRGGRRP